MVSKVTVRVPATSANLGPGFDCLGLALSLYNRITFQQRSNGLSISVSGEGEGVIPVDETNLVYRAARRIFSGRARPTGLEIQIENNIPVGSGLGSSAAAVLGGMLAANAMLDRPLDQPSLLALASEMEGHPDNVAPALYGGLTIAIQDGDTLVVERVSVPSIRVVVVMPAFELLTAQARAALPKSVPMGDAVFNTGRTAMLVQALSRGDYSGLGMVMADRLHQPYRLPLIPGMDQAFAAARQAGAAGVALSGAGPSLIALAEVDHEQIAQAAEMAFRAAGLSCRSWLLAVDQHGSRVET